ncbi:MAG: hypothetical protein P9L99_09610 [Candidatus Lernaella stagnicola]|nr:hypothetical protein [Candidatus Lernaella stagnicola]
MTGKWAFIAVLAAFLVATALWLNRPSANAEESLVDCARQESLRNFSTFKDYTCRIQSHRKVWKTDGVLHKRNYLLKKLLVLQPDKRREVFVEGTLNGEKAEEKDFIFERLGFDKGLDISDIECFRPDAAGRFAFEERPDRVIAFRSLAPGKTKLQTGKINLASDSCRVVRISGRFVHRKIVNNEVDFVTTFRPVAKSVWLPSDMSVSGTVNLGIIKRRIEAKKEFLDYRLNVGLTAADFD